jgi:hypothetical protein
VDISIREAAVLLGRSQRTLRAQLARGEIAGRKQGSRWVIARHDLPLTEAQREALALRAGEIRETVERALPSRVAAKRGQRRRSLADLDTFRLGREVLLGLHGGSADGGERRRAAEDSLETGLLALAEGVHAFDPGEKIAALRRARSGFSRAAALLLLEAGEPPREPELGSVVRLENEVLPSLAGLLRWSEKLAEKRR